MTELFKHARTLRGRIASIQLDRACRNPSGAQRAFLLSLIRRNRETLFGREHDFQNIRTEEDFRRRVPVRDYEGFRAYVRRILEGEPCILTHEKPLMMALTSGTTSNPKYIPITRTLQRQTMTLMSAWLYRAERDHAGLLRHASVGIASRAVEGHTASGIPCGSASGLIYKNIPWLVRSSYAVPYLVSEIEDYDERYKVTARFALARRVSVIATPNPATLLRLAEVAASHQESLLRSIHDGTLGLEDSKQKDIAGRLAAMLGPDRARARELEAVIKRRGFLRLADCWPELRLIGCWTGGSAGVKLCSLERFYGDVPVRDLGYMASEGRVTIPTEDYTASGLPSLNTGYYEFIPEEEEDADDPYVLSIGELEGGRRYSILLTTAGGLYRYRIDDIVEVTGFQGRTPLLSFVRKAGEMTNITGEKMHVNHLIEAIREVSRRFRLRVEQFRAAPDMAASRYELYLELERSVPHALLRDEVLPALDCALARVNMEYEQKRRSKRLREPRIHLMERGWAERAVRRAVEAGRRDTQYKWQVLCQEGREEDAVEIRATIEAIKLATPAAKAFAA